MVDESIGAYFQDIRTWSSYREENEQWNQVRQYLPLVIKLAKQYQNRGLDYIDLIQAGNIGLMFAIKTYKEEKGMRFLSWAARCVRQEIVRAIADEGRIIRLPESVVSLLNRYRYFRQEWVLEHDQEPSLEVTAEYLQITREMGTQLLMLSGDAGNILSLDFFYEHNDGTEEELSDFVGDEEQNPEALLLQTGKDIVEQLLSGLSTRERQVIAWRTGLEDEHRTYEEIATYFGRSREGVTGIEQRALMKMRRNAHLLGLKRRSGE